MQKDSEPEREGETDAEEVTSAESAADVDEGPTATGARTTGSEGEDRAAQRALLEELAQAIAGRGLAGPAIFVLESMRPVSFVTAEFMVFLEPFARAFFSTEKYRLLYEALHDRKNLTWLVDRLEELDEQHGRGGSGTRSGRDTGKGGGGPGHQPRQATSGAQPVSEGDAATGAVTPDSTETDRPEDEDSNDHE